MIDCYFIRELSDLKISFQVETFGKIEMNTYAGWYRQALALSHARSGDSAMLSGYMGKNDTFDNAIADFSFAYADQNVKDYTSLRNAIREGKLEADFKE